MRYYIIAGEASGDLHAANLVKELKKRDSSAMIRGWGGDKMKGEGVEIVKHYRELAFMGFWEVLINLFTILRNISFCKKDILAFQPDVVILVDYPGFNLRIARFLKEQKIKIFYYISPQVWAWKSSRVHLIKRTVDKMFVILPFEKEFYKKWNYDVEFVGHPLLDAIENWKANDSFFADNKLDNKPVIAVLPGSRRQEIIRMLPKMLEMAHLFPGYQLVVAGISQHEESLYRQFIHHPDVKIVIDQTYDLLENSFAAMVTSGTATLETALFNVPQVVCYSGNWASYLIGRLLVKVKFIALINLIMERKIVQELIQRDLNTGSLKKALANLMDVDERARILTNYRELKAKLGGPGASSKAAGIMVKMTVSN